jgi:hypothetical protein
LPAPPNKKRRPGLEAPRRRKVGHSITSLPRGTSPGERPHTIPHPRRNEAPTPALLLWMQNKPLHLACEFAAPAHTGASFVGTAEPPEQTVERRGH